MHTQTDTLTEIVAAQVEALSEIERILDSERLAIQQRDSNELLDVSDKKSQAMRQLSKLESERRALSASLASSQQNALQELLERCRQRNQDNAVLLNTHMQHVTRLLALLRGSNSGSGYDVDGRQTYSARRQIDIASI